jgi:hypothetical protein
MLRKILIGSAILVLLVIGSGAYLFYKILPSIREVERNAEAKLKILQPRVIVSADSFKRLTFYNSDGIGNISQIQVGWPGDREGSDIAVVGNHGADFIESSGQTIKRIRFSSEQLCEVALARIDPAGGYGYLTREQSWACPVTLFNQEGKVVWTSGGRWQGVDDSTAGNINGDQTLSVVVGLNGGGGIVLLDASGREVWAKKEANVWHVETLDTNGDGREEIIHSDAGGQLLVRDGKGTKIAQYLPEFYVAHFALTRWGEEAKPTHILVPVSEKRDGCCKPFLIVLDSAGKKVAELESPMGDLFDRYNATPVRFKDGSEYFAVLGNYFALGRSILLVYDDRGGIAYQEILGESCLGLAALAERGSDRLLVGCNAKVWEYSETTGAEKAVKGNISERE